ncbi:unnamed protein product [Cladocopium goreaui]|uniref:Uncharacterized protein n=1 Tax=Cladocopium goreaui TaxID=2562237 RepID=A0A9P1GAY3_9DINO|nr:unnamed protein product [Cladocopium goreaui]
MESTVPVVPVPKQTVTSDGGEVKAMPTEEPGSFVATNSVLSLKGLKEGA